MQQICHRCRDRIIFWLKTYNHLSNDEGPGNGRGVSMPGPCEHFIQRRRSFERKVERTRQMRCHRGMKPRYRRCLSVREIVQARCALAITALVFPVDPFHIIILKFNRRTDSITLPGSSRTRPSLGWGFRRDRRSAETSLQLEVTGNYRFAGPKPFSRGLSCRKS